MTSLEKIAKILGVETTALEKLDREMGKITGKKGVIEKLSRRNDAVSDSTLNVLNSKKRSVSHVRSVLRKTVVGHENALLKFLETAPGAGKFEKAAVLAKRITKVGKGFFLKKDRAETILKSRRPEGLLDFLKLASVEEALSKYDTTEIFSALRFTESEEWMHETFEAVYGGFKEIDFEEREIEARVLGPDWKEIAKKFVAKKHHNVSHLKEFGVIFLNPIKTDIPGKFLRDFALLLHYFHEIRFYSDLFRKYSREKDFSERFKSLLRGDVGEIYSVGAGEWLIVQRYLSKQNPNDPRLFIPRVNPESMHWARGERDLALFAPAGAELDLSLWRDLDWVGGIFKDGEREIVSFDLEDNAMSLVSFMEGKEEFFSYHQREAMWTKIFEEYAGGEEKMERLIAENFTEGVVKFS